MIDLEKLSKEHEAHRFNDLSGQKFHRLTVLEPAYRKYYKCGSSDIFYKCKCDCGKEIYVSSKHLKDGRTHSCGCYYSDVRPNIGKTHGMSHHRLYHIFNNMRSRCERSNFPKFKSYGGRGIKICKEWDNFENFAKWALENGYNDGLSIDRIDNDGDYCPINCRWVDSHIQSTNRNVHKNNKTGYTGIYHSKDRFCAQITVKGKRIFIGYFKTIKDAVCARNGYIKNNNLTEYKIQEI